jgi:GntR family transcriptional regulator
MSTLPTPKYHQLAETFRQQIQSRELLPGDQIPSEPALCETYRLSRGTVRQALQGLVDDGLLRRDQGRGTFVAEPMGRSQHFSLSSFADEMRRQRRVPSTRLLTSQFGPASAEVAERLSIESGTPVFHIKRLRLADAQPVVIESRYLAKSLCPDLLGEDLEKASLHWLFLKKYNIPLVRMEHIVELKPLSGEAATLLQVPRQAETTDMAFHVDRLTFTTDSAGSPIPAVWFQAIYSESNYYIQTHTG